MSLTDLFIDLAERGFVPDFLIRAGIRKLCRKRLLQCRVDDCEANAELAEQYLQSVDQSPLAVLTEKANEQHYEVPSDFYQMVLGKNLKYSCCHFDDSVSDLSMAEDRSLALTCEHADLHDGQRILELGCGWGSLSLWMAANFPGARITSVSNSHSQREYIISEAKSRNLPNLEVVTAGVASSPPRRTSNAWCPWKCSSTFATTAGFFGAFTIGWNRVANSSLTSSVTVRPPIPSWSRERTIGCHDTFSVGALCPPTNFF